jgi:hypothetical protein
MRTTGVLLTLLGISLCSVETAWAQKGKPPASPCGADIPLSVVIHDDAAGDSLHSSYVLISDGKGPYVHGVEKVSAVFGVESCLFNFKLNTMTTDRYLQLNLDPSFGIGPITSQFLNFSRIASVPITGLTVPSPEWHTFCDAVPAVVESSFQSDKPQDNYAGCGQDATGAYVLRYAGGTLYEGPTRNYKLRYNNTIYDGYSGDCTAFPDMCRTSFVRMGRMALTADPPRGPRSP